MVSLQNTIHGTSRLLTTVQKEIAFIGGGNMAASLIGGLVGSGWPAGGIRVADPDSSRSRGLATRFGVVDARRETKLQALTQSMEGTCN